MLKIVKSASESTVSLFNGLCHLGDVVGEATTYVHRKAKMLNDSMSIKNDTILRKKELVSNLMTEFKVQSKEDLKKEIQTLDEIVDFIYGDK